MSKKIELVDRVAFIKQESKGKKVLHLGCTNWPYTADSIAQNMLLHSDLEKIAAELHGFDFDQEGIDLLIEDGSRNLYRADLERLDEVPLDATFDVIIAGEMIEHLNNPGRFFDGIKRFMNPETRLVITTINAYSAMRFAMYGLRGRGGENEPVHPDHVAYYSYRTLKLVVERNDLELKQFCFYDVGPEHRPHLRWFYKLVNDVSVKMSPQLCDGVIAVCGLRNG
ncbi:MAG: methyltransferase domain-containing protein [Acidobacteria bacterium]|nr:methyltransferase domain-containing protein [Acidobacteriota bacterium]